MHLSLLSRARFLALLLAALVVAVPLAVAPPADAAVKKPLDIVKEIGRASCRERV